LGTSPWESAADVADIMQRSAKHRMVLTDMV
jgi:hypothetical protein